MPGKNPFKRAVSRGVKREIREEEKRALEQVKPRKGKTRKLQDSMGRETGKRRGTSQR